MRGLIHLSYFAWVVVPLAIYGIYTTYGTPHGLWEYEYIHNSYAEPFWEHYHTSCTYWGATGLRTTSASGGQCWYVAFFKEEAR